MGETENHQRNIIKNYGKIAVKYYLTIEKNKLEIIGKKKENIFMTDNDPFPFHSIVII